MSGVQLLDMIAAEHELPEGCDHWAIRSVRPDLRSSRGYRWPYPGQVAEAPGPALDHRGSCPREIGDGICVATTWEQMASGGIPALSLLLVAYADTDLLGDSTPGKLRVRRCHVVDLIDGARLLRERGQDANLRGADLRGADLRGADLWGAGLRDADLRGADLWGAGLRDANLWGANLWGANLWGANLQGADLRDDQREYAWSRGAIL